MPVYSGAGDDGSPNVTGSASVLTGWPWMTTLCRGASSARMRSPASIVAVRGKTVSETASVPGIVIGALPNARSIGDETALCRSFQLRNCRLLRSTCRYSGAYFREAALKSYDALDRPVGLPDTPGRNPRPVNPPDPRPRCLPVAGNAPSFAMTRMAGAATPRALPCWNPTSAQRY